MLASFASRPLAIAALLATILPTNALYFYMDSDIAKCFYEELPKDTLVVGHYETAIFDNEHTSFFPYPDLQIHITVEEIFDNDHRVVSNHSPHQGRFTFTAADSGDHRICFRATNAPTHGGWLTGGQSVGVVKFSLDLVIGETSDIQSSDTGTMLDLAQKVKDLNGRLEGIKREQVFQREREAEFRDQSESTNSRVVRWTLIQLAVLGITCAWQLSHLRAFFIKQKLT